MIIANTYNHLNALEFLQVRKPQQYEEIIRAISGVNANDYLKISCDVSRIGKVLYSQGEINEQIKRILQSFGWEESRISYYVTDNEETTREIVNIKNKEQQKEIIESRGHRVYREGIRDSNLSV